MRTERAVDRRTLALRPLARNLSTQQTAVYARSDARSLRNGSTMPAIVDDTFAEAAVRSLYAEVLITARDRVWLDHAVNAATGNASSTILCDCEAGLDRYVGPGGDPALATPDGRPGAVVQFHVPRFRKDRVEALERALLVRISQNVLTCPTTACFNLLDEPTFFKLGRKLAFFGDGHQFRDVRFDRPRCGSYRSCRANSSSTAASATTTG